MINRGCKMDNLLLLGVVHCTGNEMCVNRGCTRIWDELLQRVAIVFWIGCCTSIWMYMYMGCIWDDLLIIGFECGMSYCLFLDRCLR